VAVARSIPDLWRRSSVEVRADDWVVHRGPMELLVAGTTPFYGRGLLVNPGARPNAGALSLRVYPGPAPRLGIEAGRWVLGMAPHARRINARRVELRSTDGTEIPVQADGDLLGARTEWSFEIRPRAVRLIGRWG
jgi:diacylglycerol kinase family enzyme